MNKLVAKVWNAIFPKKTIAELKLNLPREEIIRRSRILIIDDERPDLTDDLIASRFSVDYVPDITKENLDLVDRPTHDLILLDYGDVGSYFGSDQGLSLLRHIKRVNPAVVILAYTSKSLDSSQADFYRQVDGVLSKDAGVQDSTERIEEGLRKAHSIANVWSALITVAGIAPGSSQDADLQHAFVGALTNRKKMNAFKSTVIAIASSEHPVQAVAQALVGKLIELGIKSTE